MADETRPAVGLSIGATNLAAVTADHALTRKPVLTLYRQRPPEVGVPSENPRLGEPGLVITNFAGKVGAPAGIVAADGSTHRSEALVADGLRALAYTATGGRALPDAVAVTYPAHWRSAAVDALRAALSRVSEWLGGLVSLLPDAVAALTALQANPGVPARGIVAVCDFGGSGTSITLIDATNGCQPVAPTVRHTGFSGDLIDQAVLNHVVADLSTAGWFDASGTSAFRSLARLRAECRTAKEQLSSSSVTTLNADLPGFRDDIRVTRTDLDDVIRPSLDGFVPVMRETLERNGIRSGDLAAVASVGGGASIPMVTTTLSEHLRAPVITAPRPHLTAAVGAALRAARRPVASQTALAPTAAGFRPATEAVTISAVDQESSAEPAFGWSAVDDHSGIMPVGTGEYLRRTDDADAPPVQPPANVDLAAPRPAEARQAAWYRRPVVVILGTALVVLAVGAAIMITLRHTSGGGPTTPAPNVSTTPGSSAPATESPTPGSTQPPVIPPISRIPRIPQQIPRPGTPGG
jgi:actin-like ATPase involved in cell morphogenesis